MSVIGDDEAPRKSIFQIPCFLTSLSSGASGGLIVGVVYYMGTSNVRKMHQLVMGSFLTFSLGTWCFCRTQRSNAIEMIEENNKMMQDIESSRSS